MKKIISVMLLTAHLTPSLAFANNNSIQQDPLIAPIKQGQIAPWTGVLLNAAAVGSIKFDKDHEQERVDVAVKKAVSDVTVQKNGEIDILKATCNSSLFQKDSLIEEREGQIKLLREENNKLREDLIAAPNRTTWFGIGFAGGILVAIASAIAVAQVTK